MELNEYQRRAMSTCMPSCENFGYMMLGLGGEMGELMGKAAKHIRKGEAVINHNQFLPMHPDGLSAEAKAALKAEAGDCFWMLAGLCSVMGWTMEEVCQGNLDKLADRAARGVIDGNGDNR